MSDKMQKKILRVLIYSDHFFPSIGGSENYALDLALELTRQGHVVGVITAEPVFDADSFSFRVFRLRKPLSPRKMNLNFLEIPAISKQFKPDIFHINYQTGGENLLIPLLKVMGIPFTITYHADHIVTLGRMMDELQLVSTFRCANAIMVQSERDEKKFISRGIQREKLVLFRFNGIDTEKYKCESKGDWDPKTIKLLCIARLDDSHKYKGIQELIDGMKTLNGMKKPFELSLSIVGDGNLKNQYERECRAYPLDNVNFLGNLSFEQMIKEICSASFLILPSIDKAEGFGRVALEAMSCGTPVIVSKYAGIAELITKYNAGIVYDPEDYKSLINILTIFLKEPDKIQMMITNTKKMLYSGDFSVSDTTKRVLEIYHSLKRP